MRRSRRATVVAFVIVNAILIAFLVVWSRRPAVSPSEVPEQRLGIDASVNELEKETWEQSIANLLTNGNQFSADGFRASVAFADVELEQMLSSRRSIKVLNRLQDLPMDKRIQECKALFYRAMHEHEKSTEGALRTREELGFTPEGRYFRPMHAICLALFATAETGRRDVLAEQLSRLDELQSRVERRVSQRDIYSDRERAARIKICVPEPRSVLNVVRLAVSRDQKAESILLGIDSYCRSLNLTSNKVPIVPWNARTTWFDTRVGSTMDTSKGVTTYLFYDWSDDLRLDFSGIRKREIAQKVRELGL